MNRPERYRKY